MVGELKCTRSPNALDMGLGTTKSEPFTLHKGRKIRDWLKKGNGKSLEIIF